jgi:hypothetical protein
MFEYELSNDQGMHCTTMKFKEPDQSAEVIKQFADGISSVMELAKLTQRDRPQESKCLLR